MQRDYQADVEFDIDRYPFDPERVKRDVKEGTEIPDAVLIELIAQDQVSTEEIVGYIRTRYEESQE